MGVVEQLEDALKEQTGCRDRTLAEYVHNIGSKSEATLQQELSGFPPAFITKIVEILNPPDQLKIGGVYTGKVTNIKPFGIFVDLDTPSGSGLVHRSQLDAELTAYRPGDVICVQLVNNKDGKLAFTQHRGRTNEDMFEMQQIQASSGKRQSLTKVEDLCNSINLKVYKTVPAFLSDNLSLFESMKLSNQPEPTETDTCGWLGKAAQHTFSKVSAASTSSRNNDRRSNTVVNTSSQRNNSQRNRKLRNQAAEETVVKKLPIHAFETEIMQAVASNPIVVLVGDTGSGKTTQLTQFLYGGGYSMNNRVIACTQPRRLAAISVSERVSQEMGCSEVGGLVGYLVRFDNCTNDSTRVKFMTDGMLQREAILDPDLSKYSVIILDEAHERTVATDVLFALLKTASARRPDLRVIVTSATLDADRFSEYFGGASILRIPGRTFPVEVKWADEPVLDYVEAVMTTVKRIHELEAGKPGDILVFLTGQAEINLAVEAVPKMFPSGDLIPIPVYAAIPSDMQSLIFDPAPEGKRKVIFATNIAETSLTIDGILHVVDPGFAKVMVWNAKKGMGILQVRPISQAQANQRKGRAGRTAPGTCYRLYTERSFEDDMQPSTIPEIQRANLGYTVLTLKAMGIRNALNFDFMDPPSTENMLASLHELYMLKALDENGDITPLGREMSKYPLEPALARTLVEARNNGQECLDDALSVIAMLSMPPVFYRPPSKERAKQELADRIHGQLKVASGDHMTCLKIYCLWVENNYSEKWCKEHFIQFQIMVKVRDARNQLATLAGIEDKPEQLHQRGKSAKSTTLELTKIRTTRLLKSLSTGYLQNVAKLSGPRGEYVTLATDLEVSIHPSSSLFRKGAKYVLYNSLVSTNKNYMHSVSEVEPQWLAEAVPGYFSLDTSSGTISGEQATESIKPLYKKFKTHKNEWRVSEQRKTLMGCRKG